MNYWKCCLNLKHTIYYNMYLKYVIHTSRLNMIMNAYTSRIVFGMDFVFIGSQNTNDE